MKLNGNIIDAKGIGGDINRKASFSGAIQRSGGGGGGGSLPTGGNKGEVLKKQSDTDGDVAWEKPLFVFPVTLSGTTATANVSPADVITAVANNCAFASYGGSLVPCVDHDLIWSGETSIVAPGQGSTVVSEGETSYSFYFRGPIVDSNGNLKIAEFTFEDQAKSATTMTGTGSVTSVGGGGGTTEIEWVTYGTTTSAEIEAAYQAGKVVCCKKDGYVYTLVWRDSATHHVFTLIYNRTRYSLSCTSDTWAESSVLFASAASLPAASSATPQDLGTAAAGSSTDYARADHVHKKPSAADIGAIPAPAAPSSGQFLVYNGSAWTAQTLATWQGGNY